MKPSKGRQIFVFAVRVLAVCGLSILGHGETRNKWLTKQTGYKDAEKWMGGNRVGDSDKHNYPLKMRGTWKEREGISPSETLKGKKGVRFL
jgi:hypothetical protein